MMTRYIYLFMISIALMFSSSQKQIPKVDAYELLTAQSTYTAGDEITLSFSSAAANLSLLKVNSNLGSIIVTPEKRNSSIDYNLPDLITQQAGEINWKLLNSNITGNFKIMPDSIARIASYVGPPTMVASPDDFTMLTVIPVDQYDNPQVDGTMVQLDYFKDGINFKQDLPIQNLLAFETISTSTAAGKVIVSTNANAVSGKEHTIDVMAGEAVGFTLSRKRNHNYADGNQIAQFFTSPITDQYGNLVTDGTLVEFHVTSDAGSTLQTTGTTINGVASGTMVHPEKAQQWNIQAIVSEMAVSDVMELSFEDAVKDFEVSITGREIQVSSLASFIGQKIPDGFTVTLSVKGNGIHEVQQKGSLNGSATFVLNPEKYASGAYDLEITAGSISKQLKSIKL